MPLLDLRSLGWLAGWLGGKLAGWLNDGLDRWFAVSLIVPSSVAGTFEIPSLQLPSKDWRYGDGCFALARLRLQGI